MKKILFIILALLAVGVAAGLRFVSARESLATQRAAVGSSWSAVDAALREHADLLPTLTARVKAPPKLEAQALQTITEARGVLDRAQAAPEKIQAYQRLSRESARLLLAAEQNSGLRTDKGFLLLKEQLTGTDNRIMVARRKYNEALERYNASLAIFPHNVVAAISGYSRDDAYFPTGLESRPFPKE